MSDQDCKDERREAQLDHDGVPEVWDDGYWDFTPYEGEPLD